ncbi:NADH dehydrogenase [ubiquinone] 1 beta subcomplex subunit 9 [Gryllus bimaculatus]|nr:NADH dehydrogenase [ubiquinone] 1 beta subcomplex subunit 9 [Gryllus bimaculatus]
MAVPTVGAEVISHSRRVCSLYKRALRCLECYYDKRFIFRYQATLMRDRFEQNKDIKDMRIAKELLLKGEEELFIPLSPGGVAYARTVNPPDWVLDYWHPLEKAQYPQYFACREQRKKEFIELWEKQYGKPSKEDLHH